ncbi:hypothetical protein JCM6292_1752 [Bacteroides pyogenes JCM 6292]|uniref:Uncharacterized protein n=2 Tax=Bacteroides pyogenes TaxID=310300 RepID=W4PJU6_9BACE|nr:hypothetical protein JCM6292_1752 [Bacteroides pyogenes JCM 6292]GAE19399.1 hypothetical protein JCM6294_2445 [Bacteroides pyogenes DSM 20611 = JCM 6294]
MGYFTDTMGEHAFKPLGVDMHDSFQSTWGLFGILALSGIIAWGLFFYIRTVCSKFA